MGMTTGVIVGGSNHQNNVTSNVNTRGGHFSHFETIEANPFREFEAFEENNNNPPSGNNNNNLPPLLPPSGFKEGLERGFNPLSEGNTGGLDPNVAALVNALTGANLGINHGEKESNHIKPIEFEKTEAEVPNKWLE